MVRNTPLKVQVAEHEEGGRWHFSSLEITSHLMELRIGQETAFSDLLSPLQDPVKPVERRFSSSSECLLSALREKASIHLTGWVNPCCLSQQTHCLPNYHLTKIHENSPVCWIQQSQQTSIQIINTGSPGSECTWLQLSMHRAEESSCVFLEVSYNFSWRQIHK